MSTTVISSGTLKCVSNTLAEIIAKKAHSIAALSGVGLLASQALGGIEGSPKNALAVTLFLHLQKANIHSVKEAYPDSWGDILPEKPEQVSLSDFDNEQYQVPYETPEGLQYLIPAIDSVIHGIDDIDFAKKWHDSLSDIHSILPLALAQASHQDFSATKIAPEVVAESIVRLKNGGDRFYNMQNGTNSLLARLEVETRQKLYYADSVFLTVLQASMENTPVILPDPFDDESMGTVSLTNAGLLSTGSYALQGDIPAPTEQDFANLHHGLFQANAYMQQAGQGKVLHTDGKTPFSDHDTDHLSMLMRSTLKAHAFHGQTHLYTLDPNTTFSHAMEKREQLHAKNKVVYLIGQGSVLESALKKENMKVNPRLSERQNFIVHASNQPGLHLFDNNEQAKHLLAQTQDTSLVAYPCSAHDLHTVPGHYVRFRPANIALMAEQLKDLSFNDGAANVDDVIQRLTNDMPALGAVDKEKMATLLAEPWVNSPLDVANGMYVEVATSQQKSLLEAPVDLSDTDNKCTYKPI
jgi:hypothetical protein